MPKGNNDNPLPVWAKPGEWNDTPPKQYSQRDIVNMPLFYLQRQDVWRRADTQAKVEMRERSIELIAQSLNDKDERNLRQLARRYPDMSPGVMQGLANGTPWVMPDGTTPEPFSDQGDPMIRAFDAQYAADVESAVDDQTYGATGANPVPQAEGLPAINIFAGVSVPSSAQTYDEEPETPWTTDAARLFKGAANTVMNIFAGVSEAENAATETSAGNEQLMREGIKKFGLDEADAREVYGDDYLPADAFTNTDITRTATSDPRAGAGAALFNLFNTNEQNTPSEDPTVPQADLSVPVEDRIAQAKAEWRQHLVDTGQIDEQGNRSMRNITGRITLNKQRETGTMGQGGWFGGGVDEEVDKAVVALAGRQSDIRPYAARQASKAVADVIKQQYKDAGQQLSLDDYTMITSPRTWTEGRAVTGELGMSPGTLGEMMLSGSIDLVFTLGTDPFSYTPPGLVKTGAVRGINAASKLRPAVRAGEKAAWFELDEMFRKARKGEDIQVEEDVFGPSDRPNTERIDNYTWDTDKTTGEWFLKDETGTPTQSGPRLKRKEKYEEYFDGWRVEKRVPQGKKTPEWVVMKDGNVESTHTTRTAARQHVETTAQFTPAVDMNGKPIPIGGRKEVETWEAPDGTVSDLPTAMTKVREQYLMEQGIPQARVTTSKAAWDWLMQSVSGNAFTKAVADMDSFYEIWLRSGRKIPTETAVRLAAAKTPEEVRAVMSSAIGPQITDPSALRAFQGVRADAFNAKIKLANTPYLKRMYRAMSFAPQAVPVDMNDMDQVVETAHRFGTAVGMTPKQMQPLIDEIVSQQSHLTTFNTFHDRFIMSGVRNALRKSGVDDDKVSMLLEKVRNARKGKALPKAQGLRQERTRTGALESVADLMSAQNKEAGGAMLDTSIADGTFVKGVQDEIALFAHELSASHIVLPTARELRREMNKVAQVLQKADPTDKALVDSAFNMASRFLDTWRNFTLMNVSYMFRNIAEEIMTMSLLGGRSMLTHPVQSIAAIMAIHAAQEYASGGRALRKATDRALPFKRAIRQMRYKPEKYQGVRLVDKAALRSLVTRAQGDAAVAEINGRGARTAKGRTADMNGFIRDVERGIVDPIEVTVDYRNGTFGVTDGVKRLLAAFDSDDISDVPVRIVPGRVENGRPLPYKTTKRTRLTGSKVQGGQRVPTKVTSTKKQAFDEDWRHEELFGAAAVTGDLKQVQEAAKQAVSKQLGAMRALRYVFPYFDHNLAMADGQSMYHRLDEAVKRGSTQDVPLFLQFATRLYGSALMEEHPDKVLSNRRIYDSSGQNVTLLFPREKDGTQIEQDSQLFQEYVRHYADVLGELAADEMTVDILAGRKTIDELTMEIVSDPKRLQNILGTLKQGVYDTAANATRNGGKQLDLIDPADIIRYHQEQAYDTVRGVLQENLRSVGKYLGDGTSPLFKQVVVDGQVNGKVLNSRNRKLRRMIAEELDANESFRNAVPGLRKADLIEPKILDRFTTKFFSAAGNMRDMITLHPFMRDEYVKEVVRLSKYMSREGREEMIDNLRLANDEAFADQILEQPYSGKNGWLDPGTVHSLADVATRKAAEKAFYNAANRRNWALAMRWASPFAQAAVNSTYRWGTAMARDPIATYRTARSLNAINDAMGEWVGIYEPELEDQMGVKGYLDRNQYGDEVFVYPLVGKLAGLLGFDKSAATFTAASVNVFQTGVVTGLGPVAMFGLGLTPFRDVQARNDVLGDIFRFFQPFPVDQSGIGETYTRAGEAFIPAKWRGIVNVDDDQVNRLSHAILVARLSSGEYGPIQDWTGEQATMIAQDLNNDARRLLRMEGITKLFGPLLGSFTFSPMINTSETAKAMPEGVKGKAVLDYMITAEFQAYVGDSGGDERQKRTTLFMKDYGPYMAAAGLGRTESGVQNQPVYTNSGSVTNFAYEEPGLYRKYRNSIGFMFKGGDYETQWTDYDRFQREQDKASGVLKPRDVANQVEFTRQYMMRWQKQERINQAVKENPDNLDDVIRGINDHFSDLGLKGYDEDYRNFMMGQLERAVADPDVLKNVKSATYINEYFKARKRVTEYIRKNTDLAGSFDGDTVWTQNDAVRQLYLAGVKTAEKDPGFGNFWVSLGEAEFGDMPEKYLGEGA